MEVGLRLSMIKQSSLITVASQLLVLRPPRESRRGRSFSTNVARLSFPDLWACTSICFTFRREEAPSISFSVLNRPNPPRGYILRLESPPLERRGPSNPLQTLLSRPPSTAECRSDLISM